MYCKYPDATYTEAHNLDGKLAQFKRRLLVYLSGKYRDKSEWAVEQNIQTAEKVAAELWNFGYAVICPHKNTAHFGGTADDSVWLEGDMVMVERSDLVVMLDSWEASEGARLERRLAMKLGIPVYYWGHHQLCLQRLASDDHRMRSSRSAILDRAYRIGTITGWTPSGVHVSDSADPGTCDSCGNPRGEGHNPYGTEPLRERLRRDLEKGPPDCQTPGYFGEPAVRPRESWASLDGGESQVSGGPAEFVSSEPRGASRGQVCL